MGFRFRKSIKLSKGVRLNLSKKGVGVSTGIKGARVGVGPRGVRQTVSIPGTGMSFVKENRLSSTKANYDAPNSGQNTFTDSTTLPHKKVKYPKKIWFFIILGLLTIPIFIGMPILIYGLYNINRYKQKDEVKAISLFNDAIKKLANDEHSLAIDLLSKAYRYNPDDEDIMYYLMMYSYEYLNDYENSLKLSQKLLVLNEDNVFYKYCLASSYYKLKKYNKAIKLLQELQSNKELQEEVIILLGKSFFKLGKYNLALEVLNRGPVRRRNPDPSMMEARYYLGLTCLKLGNNSRAKTHLSAVYSNDINYKNIQSYKHLIT
ncbi:DUF4236 domain-containing protein [Proteinivorax tanatarense]|uniref:DUF4236 domain-containing protein n=1 Tax=Proteinivorax tanatarense TaxID=1260629 RepID=A0AAU7VIK5_9FIRM